MKLASRILAKAKQELARRRRRKHAFNLQHNAGSDRRRKADYIAHEVESQQRD